MTRPPQPQRIMESVASFWSVTVDDLTGSSRQRHIILPRQVAMYLMRRKSRLTLTRVGFLFGLRDHTTVIHAVRRIEDAMKVDDELRAQVNLLISDMDAEYRLSTCQPHEIAESAGRTLASDTK